MADAQTLAEWVARLGNALARLNATEEDEVKGSEP